jgi:hypothetical protein
MAQFAAHRFNARYTQRAVRPIPETLSNAEEFSMFRSPRCMLLGTSSLALEGAHGIWKPVNDGGIEGL